MRAPGRNAADRLTPPHRLTPDDERLDRLDARADPAAVVDRHHPSVDDPARPEHSPVVRGGDEGAGCGLDVDAPVPCAVRGGRRDEAADDPMRRRDGPHPGGRAVRGPGGRHEQRGGEESGEHGPMVLPASRTGERRVRHIGKRTPCGAWGGADAPAGRVPASC
jgi:hypothetical protein